MSRENSLSQIFIWGMMGSGKSRNGRMLAENLSVPFYDLDAIIEQQEGRTVAEIFKLKGEDQFRLLERDALNDWIATQNGVLSTGGGTPCYFNNAEKMKSAGTCIWINPPVEVMIERVSKSREERPLLTGDNWIEEFIARNRQRLAWYSTAHHEVTSGELVLKLFN